MRGGKLKLEQLWGSSIFERLIFGMKRRKRWNISSFEIAMARIYRIFIFISVLKCEIELSFSTGARHIFVLVRRLND